MHSQTTHGETISDRFSQNGFNEECAVFGVYGTPNAAVMTALGLHALQHRGVDATGIASFDGTQHHAHHGLGQVGDVFGAETGHFQKLKGFAAIGHNRYSTTGRPELRNIQPFISQLAFGSFAMAHNGNLLNAARLRQSLVDTGSLMQSTTDSEAIVHLVARSHQDKPSLRLIDALKQVEGAYSLVCLTPEGLVGCRDPHGVRPLVLGRHDQAYILASETCGLDIIGAEYIRDLEPGEMILINNDGITSRFPFQKTAPRFCVFEYIYFARPDSIIDGQSVYQARKNIGRELARESLAQAEITQADIAQADIVVPVPDSGVPAALGYAEESGLPFEMGIIRNHYIGRTFIQPDESGRQVAVKMKHNANTASVKGKSIILVDDSIVRGTTSRKIVAMMRHAGAKEIHMRIASPPTKHPCFYGVDTPDQDKLIAARLETSQTAQKIDHEIAREIAREIDADSLAFISMDGLYRALGWPQGRDAQTPQMCDACFSGTYPITSTYPIANTTLGENNP